MLKLWENTISHALSSTTRMSRRIRRHMKHVEAIAEQGEFEEKWELVQQSIAAGLYEDVHEHFTEVQKLLMEEGILELEDLEKDLEDMEWAVEKKFVHEDLEKLFEAIREAFGFSKGDAKPLDEAERLIHKMREKALAEIQKQYQAYMEQAREAQNHDFVTRARGVMKLASAMRDVYKLRKEDKVVANEIEVITEESKRIIQALEHEKKALDSHVQNRERDLAPGKVNVRIERLDEKSKQLSIHVGNVFEMFTHITRVFVMYYFILHKLHDTLEAFFKQMAAEGYPEHVLAQMRHKQKNYDDKMKENEGAIMDIEARMGRKLQ